MRDMGVAAVFPAGSLLKDIQAFINTNVRPERRLV
jgi:hypothetical protein